MKCRKSSGNRYLAKIYLELQNVDGRRLVKWYDWKSYFCTLYKTIPNITYHHFRFDKKSLGIVFVQTLADSLEIAVTISSKNTVDIHKLPREMIPKGLNLKCQWYLYDEISPFCWSSETASITCPHPTQPKPNSTSNSDLLSDPMAGGPTEERAGVKCKWNCSHCHQGHTKTKKRKDHFVHS